MFPKTLPFIMIVRTKGEKVATGEMEKAPTLIHRDIQVILNKITARREIIRALL